MRGKSRQQYLLDTFVKRSAIMMSKQLRWVTEHRVQVKSCRDARNCCTNIKQGEK